MAIEVSDLDDGFFWFFVVTYGGFPVVEVEKAFLITPSGPNELTEVFILFLRHKLLSSIVLQALHAQHTIPWIRSNDRGSGALNVSFFIS